MMRRHRWRGVDVARFWQCAVLACGLTATAPSVAFASDLCSAEFDRLKEVASDAKDAADEAESAADDMEQARAALDDCRSSARPGRLPEPWCYLEERKYKATVFDRDDAYGDLQRKRRDVETAYGHVAACSTPGSILVFPGVTPLYQGICRGIRRMMFEGVGADQMPPFCVRWGMSIDDCRACIQPKP